MSVSQTPTSEPGCLVTWPTDPTQGDLMAAYIRPQHRCQLPAGHVHDVLELRRDERGAIAPHVQPHTCHCGAFQPVRDAAPVQA